MYRLATMQSATDRHRQTDDIMMTIAKTHARLYILSFPAWLVLINIQKNPSTDGIYLFTIIEPI